MKYQSIFALVLFILAACGGGQEQTQEQTDAPESMVQSDPEPEAKPVVTNEAGKKVYDQYCVVCHQASGEGVPNAFPPIVQTEYVSGDTERLIGIILNGLTGEIEVNGEVYNGVMLAHNFLSDAEVADVITYVRSNFGNEAPGVTAEEVAAVRNTP
jgi:mono/diheme cytochrome c family protein